MSVFAVCPWTWDSGWCPVFDGDLPAIRRSSPHRAGQTVGRASSVSTIRGNRPLGWSTSPRFGDQAGRRPELRCRRGGDERAGLHRGRCRGGVALRSYCAWTLGKGPDGRLSQRRGLPLQSNTHIRAHTRSTHVTNLVGSRAFHPPRQPAPLNPGASGALPGSAFRHWWRGAIPASAWDSLGLAQCAD